MKKQQCPNNIKGSHKKNVLKRWNVQERLHTRKMELPGIDNEKKKASCHKFEIICLIGILEEQFGTC